MQIDSKCLAVVSCGKLAFVDQHAADERVQLERLRRQVLADGERQVGPLICRLLWAISFALARQGSSQNFDCTPVVIILTPPDSPDPAEDTKHVHSGVGRCGCLMNPLPTGGLAA